ncbi:MAG TPA: methionyl-tRNA formyltransferase [Methylophilaceae bacterium]|nr:methionyl-tRNA formyltransferase [Methylophilaceae bacterium]HAJ72294.1 methionyl-tRNA formyltransferase [Methylophilaceae bacterium]
MKIIFAGTPEFAVPALQGLINQSRQKSNGSFEIVQVLTQPDRPAGRGMQLKASPIKQLALQHSLHVFQPESLKPEEVQTEIAAAQADVLIVAAYGLIIPTAVLNMFPKGCYNIHGSLLPRWRGAAPIHRAILAGDAETGVTIMEVVPKLDAGAMVSKWATPIQPTDTTQTLHDAIASEGAKLMVAAMQALETTGELAAEPQDESLVTYAHKLEKSECPIDWTKSALEISRQVRAFNPFPVATTQFRGETIKIWFATVSAQNGTGKAGKITALEANIHAACGQGILEIHELQMPGGKRQTATQFMQGQHLKIGDTFA